jgi:hypothetical protein
MYMPIDIKPIVKALVENDFDAIKKMNLSFWKDGTSFYGKVMSMDEDDRDRFRLKLIEILQHENIIKLLDSGRWTLQDVLETYSRPYAMPVKLLGYFSDQMIKKPEATLEGWSTFLRWEAKGVIDPEVDVEKLFLGAQKRAEAKPDSDSDSKAALARPSQPVGYSPQHSLFPKPALKPLEEMPSASFASPTPTTPRPQ